MAGTVPKEFLRRWQLIGSLLRQPTICRSTVSVTSNQHSAAAGMALSRSFSTTSQNWDPETIVAPTTQCNDCSASLLLSTISQWGTYVSSVIVLWYAEDFPINNLSNYANLCKERGKATQWQKRRLVWAKMYKTMDDVPDDISIDKMKKANDILRIRGASLMVVAFLLASYLSIRKGSQDRDAGKSLGDEAMAHILQQEQIGRDRRAREAGQA